jgi:hypothetical protein
MAQNNPPYIFGVPSSLFPEDQALTLWQLVIMRTPRQEPNIDISGFDSQFHCFDPEVKTRID